MTDTTVSFRVDKRIHFMMKMHDEINWSAIIRKTVSEKLKQLQAIDKSEARNGARIMDNLRKRKEFDKGESSTLIIRKWRDKRR